MIDELENYNKELLVRATAKNKEATSIFDWEFYENDNKKVSFYTGLPTFAHLLFVLNVVQNFVSGVNHALSPKKHVLLFLLKLRMNYLFRDMAYQLGVSEGTVSTTFHATLNAFYKRSQFLLRWPSRECIKRSMPYCFKEAFGDRTTVIIDCFELFTVTPSRQVNHVTMFSHYKSHETIKYLIGISPQGVIIFISPGYGGRASDKYIVNDCGFLDNIKPGDVVMADRGFTIQDEIGFYQAKLVIPAFTKGKKQLHPMDVESTRKIAHVRIHVERVIGLVKSKFRVFHGEIPIDLLKLRSCCNIPTIDKIVHSCCALANTCKSIVPT